MNRGKKLLKNTIIIAVGKFSTKFISFFLLPLYTSILTTSDYGLYDLLITIATFLIPCITLLMEESMFRFLIDCNSKEESNIIISQTILFTIFGLMLFSFFYFILNVFFAIPYCLLFYFFILSNIIVGLKNAITRGTDNIKIYSFSSFVTSAISLILNVYFIVFLKMGVASLLLSSIIANTFTTLFVFIFIKIHLFVFPFKFDRKKMVEMIKYSLPLVPNSISWAIINLSDRIVVSSVLGTSANGVYSVSYKFPNLMDMVYNFFYTAWKESAAKAIRDDDSNLFYNRIYDILKTIMWSAVIFLISILSFVYYYLIKKDFAASYIYVPLLIISMYFSNISGFYGGIYSAHKDTKIMGLTTLVAAFINILVDVLLINYIGIWAAAISTLISTYIVYFYRKIKLKKYTILNENYISSIINFFVLIVALVLYYSNCLIVRLICLLVVFVYLLIKNKNTFYLLKKIFFGRKVLL